MLSTRLDLLGLATSAFAATAPTLILVGEAVKTESRFAATPERDEAGTTHGIVPAPNHQNRNRSGR